MTKPGELAPWESAVAGATGAVLANAILYPLDMYDFHLPVDMLVVGKLTGLQCQDQITGPDQKEGPDTPAHR
jgi:hypothetical protein